MDTATLAYLAQHVGACSAIRRDLADRSAIEFRDFLLHPRIFRLTSAQ